MISVIPSKSLRNKSQKIVLRKNVEIGFAKLQDRQESCYRRAFKEWFPIVQASDGPLADTVCKLEEREQGLGLKHLQILLELQSPNIVIPHAQGYAQFIKWVSFIPESFVKDETSKLASLTQYLGFMNPEDKPAKRTVLKTYLQRIKWAQHFFELYSPWPTHSKQIQKIIASRLKKVGVATQPSRSSLFEGHHILKMIEAIETHSNAFVRHIIGIEVLKIVGCIRTDDSATFAPKHILITRDSKVVTNSVCRQKRPRKQLERLLEECRYVSHCCPPCVSHG